MSTASFITTEFNRLTKTSSNVKMKEVVKDLQKKSQVDVFI